MNAALPLFHRKWLLLIVKLFIAALVAWGIGRAVVDASRQIASQEFSFKGVRLGWLALSGGLYAAGLLPMWWFWHRTLWAFGQRPGRFESLRAYYIGHVGKYVPGKAMVVVLRAGFVRGGHVDTAVAAVSVFVETLTMMAVGAFLAAAILAIQFAEQRQLQLLAGALMVSTGIPTLPPVFRRLVRGLGVARASQQVDRAMNGLSYRLVLSGWLACTVGWLLLGCSLWTTIRAVPTSGDLAPARQLLPELTAAVCLANVAGFLSLLPGGVGVREWVLNQLLVPDFGSVVAIVAAVLLRCVWLVTDLLISGILYLSVRKAL